MPETVSVTIGIIKTSEHPPLAKTIKLRFTKVQGFFPVKSKEVTFTLELIKTGMSINSFLKETIREILKQL